MGRDNRRFTHESLQDRKTIKSLLAALSKGIAKGEMTLEDGDHELVLQTDGLMTVRLTAEREDGRCEVSLKMSWKDPTDKAPRKGTPKIVS